MKEVFLENSVAFITKYNKNYTEEDIEKIKYGLEGIYLTFTKLIIILFLSILLNIFKETLLVLLFLNIIRYPAFGVHADKSSICLISSIIFILGLTYLLLNINVTFYSKIIICLICLTNYFLFAPADTVKRPLTNPKKRKYRKIASCLLAIIYILLIFILNSNVLTTTIFTALIIEAIMINPITYKILGMPYNNYKNC